MQKVRCQEAKPPLQLIVAKKFQILFHPFRGPVSPFAHATLRYRSKKDI